MQPLPELGRAFVVTFDPPRPGWPRPSDAAAVVDLAAISHETLAVLLLPDEYKIPTKKKR